MLRHSTMHTMHTICFVMHIINGIVYVTQFITRLCNIEKTPKMLRHNSFDRGPIPLPHFGHFLGFMLYILYLSNVVP